ncbi:MAG: hypothetical protein OEU57_12525 [Desulfuromonadales bacterium]|nr:hypothetical protein [Desulfuromonadales bacterium]MDH4026226.1 hypothetical protein [Desulfuromonadales bacterium]
MFIRTLKLALCLMLMSVGIAHADLNAYIRDLNISAQGDIGGYKAKLEGRFGTSNSQVEVVFRSVDGPGEAAIVLWLGEQARQPLDMVLNVYRSQKSQGWGAMAKSLGIKPGSPAFHALKSGNIQVFSDGGGASSTKAKSKNKKSKKNKNS